MIYKLFYIQEQKKFLKEKFGELCIKTAIDYIKKYHYHTKKLIKDKSEASDDEKDQDDGDHTFLVCKYWCNIIRCAIYAPLWNILDIHFINRSLELFSLNSKKKRIMQFFILEDKRDKDKLKVDVYKQFSREQLMIRFTEMILDYELLNGEYGWDLLHDCLSMLIPL